MQDYCLPPHALTLEITESVLVGDTQTAQATAQLSDLRQAGIRVAMDDFGTGYSSLAYLRHLPIDSIKIDRAFVPATIPADEQQVALLRAIIDLAAGLRLDTVVEGVETAQQADLLRDLGGNLAQGFHYARPLPVDAIDRLLTESHHRRSVKRPYPAAIA